MVYLSRQYPLKFFKGCLPQNLLSLLLSTLSDLLQTFDRHFLFNILIKMQKAVFCECVETSSFLVFANNSRSHQNKKNTEHPFADIVK